MCQSPEHASHRACAKFQSPRQAFFDSNTEIPSSRARLTIASSIATTHHPPPPRPTNQRHPTTRAKRHQRPQHPPPTQDDPQDPTSLGLQRAKNAIDGGWLDASPSPHRRSGERRRPSPRNLTPGRVCQGERGQGERTSRPRPARRAWFSPLASTRSVRASPAKRPAHPLPLP